MIEGLTTIWTETNIILGGGLVVSLVLLAILAVGYLKNFEDALLIILSGLTMFTLVGVIVGYLNVIMTIVLVLATIITVMAVTRSD